MKRLMAIAVTAALIVSLSSCANIERPQTLQDSSGIEVVTSEVDESTVPVESSSDPLSESKESSADSAATAKAETESAQAQNSQPVNVRSTEAQAQPTVPNDTPEPEPPKAVEPTPEPKPTLQQQTVTPPAEEKPTPEPAPVEPPQETAPPPEESTPKSIYDYEFDISAIRSELIAIDEGMGMTHSNDLTPDTASWSTPVTASPDFQGAGLETRLKDYVRSMPGLISAFGGNQIEYFTIYAEPLGGGSYRLYFLY